MRELPESIECYPDRVRAILSWLPVDQDEFDRKASRWQPTEFYPYTLNSIILPFTGRQQEMLVVLQEMHRAGMVEAQAGDGKITYRQRGGA